MWGHRVDCVPDLDRNGFSYQSGPHLFFQVVITTHSFIRERGGSGDFGAGPTSHTSVREVGLTLVLMDTYITRMMWIDHYMRLLLTKYEHTVQTIISIPLTLPPYVASTSGRLHIDFVCLLFLQAHRELTAFLQLQEFTLHNLPVDLSSTSVQRSPHRFFETRCHDTITKACFCKRA
jgi:hypothetical protein